MTRSHNHQYHHIIIIIVILCYVAEIMHEVTTLRRYKICTLLLLLLGLHRIAALRIRPIITLTHKVGLSRS